MSRGPLSSRDSRARARVLELCSVTDGDRVLEVGAGAGSQLVALAAANPSGETVGIDLADGMLREARRRLAAAAIAHATVLRAGACDLPLDDVSCDVVVSSYVLDILAWEDIRRALTEFTGSFDPEAASCCATSRRVSEVGIASATTCMAAACR